MKNSRNEKLSEHLLNVDEEILGNAYGIDDAEKLKQYIKAKKAKAKKPFYMAPTFRGAAAIAACFVLVVGIVFSVPALFGPDNDFVASEYNNFEEIVPPWERGEDGLVSIKSIDMLNYYSAMRVLADPSNTTLAVNKTNWGITLLSANVKSDAKTYGLTFLSNSNSDVGYDALTDGYTSEALKTDEEKIYYYEVDPNEAFWVSKVIFFQIRISNEGGFLASKVGTGVVDVVITENNLEPMITFRNGDRYYSCCENGSGPSFREFSTHKYVEDLYVVKNLEQDNYMFTVYYDDLENAIGITCAPFKGYSPNADGNMPVISKTYTSQVSASFTIADLEEYFNTGKLPEGSDDGSATETLPMSDIPDVTATYYTDKDQ